MVEKYIVKYLEGRLDYLEDIIADLTDSVTECKGDDAIRNWGKFIRFSRMFMEAGTFMRSMEDITEELWEKYRKRADEIQDRAGKIVATFGTLCICKTKLE